MQKVYLDHAADTAVSSEVRDHVGQLQQELCGNPASQHLFGRRAFSVLEAAREEIAEQISAASSKEIIFTSGGTESNNLAILGAMAEMDPEAELAISTAEHASVYEVAMHLERQGRRVHLLEVDGLGRLREDVVTRFLSDHPAVRLLSAMWANNELGSLIEVAELGALCRKHSVLFHTDAVQAVGKLSVDMSEQGDVDLLSASSHKFYGPGGVGFLYRRGGVRLAPLLYGGNQQDSMRAGTENAAAASGMALALKLANTKREENHAYLDSLVEHCLDKIVDIPGLQVNGDRGLPGFLSLTFESVDAELLLLALDLDGIAVSAGSACRTGSTAPSRILLAAGMDESHAQNTVRVSAGLGNTSDNMDYFSERLRHHVMRLQGTR